MTRMKKEERAAKNYLEGLWKGDVRFEPDGNRPPDFKLASTIGIEVRRLNENYFDTDRTKGIEEVSIPLHAKFKEVLNSYDSKFDGLTYWVGLIYKRPIHRGVKRAGEDMHKALDNFLEGRRTTPCSLEVGSKIWFVVYPAKPFPNRVFRHAVTSDDDSGGLVVQFYVQNISHCIDEKAQKIVPYKNRYNEWWLLLVDTMMMAWNLDSYELQEVRTGIANLRGFNKIIVIDHFGKNCLLEIA
jgi:hypothetical protein